MMNAIEPTGPIDPTGDSGVSVLLGSTRLSLSQFQDLYSELGRRSNRISKKYKSPFVLKYEDLKNLHQRLHHLTSHYSILSQKITIEVRHSGGDTQEFNSFERFMLYDTGVSTPVLSVLYELTFALPSALEIERKVREYTVGVLIFSNVSNFKEAEDDTDGIVESDVGFSEMSAFVNIQYYDYSIAVSCLSVVNEWLKSLPVVPESATHRWICRFRTPLAFLVHGVFVVPSLVLVSIIWVQFYSPTLENVIIAAAIVAGFASTLHRVFHHTTNLFRYSVFRAVAHSIIEFNGGDKRLREWYEKKRSGFVVNQGAKLIAAVAWAVTIGVIVRAVLD